MGGQADPTLSICPPGSSMVLGAKFPAVGNPQLVGAVPDRPVGQPRTSSGIQCALMGHHASFAPETSSSDEQMAKLFAILTHNPGKPVARLCIGSRDVL